MEPKVRRGGDTFEVLYPLPRGTFFVRAVHGSSDAAVGAGRIETVSYIKTQRENGRVRKDGVVFLAPNKGQKGFKFGWCSFLLFNVSSRTCVEKLEIAS